MIAGSRVGNTDKLILDAKQKSCLGPFGMIRHRCKLGVLEHEISGI